MLAAAWRGHWLDDLVMRGNDLIFAFPSLVIAILITAVWGPSALNANIAIGIFNIPVFARVTRGAALPIWTLDYIRAAEVAGKGAAKDKTVPATAVNCLIKRPELARITIQEPTEAHG